ncbi:L,D-transpeptidase family protein [Desulfovibrio litoralis]|uniref:L,D-transpeptidase catalytic domain n=1 Tax=Desulfovibrio litoralis DSM 11393 TaxID=1121455 RepID=A0A1M7RYW5_9BACT|nr:L,D-transpeptidase family protein [Desulfovibrio litoralis]SHN51529.1 L,D-transpeptidase catalytic domain [Desulfovibrio litoralis DSM 11393]
MGLQHYPKKKRSFPSLFIFCILASIIFGIYYFYTLIAFVPPAVSMDNNQKEYPSGALTAKTIFDRLVVEKKKRLLTAYSKGKVVRIYSIALGANPVGHKQFQGDMKTPEGIYTIDGKNPNSAFYKNLGVSYPNDKDRKFARNKGKSPGGDIKIHGLAPEFAYLGSLHREYDWTYGCIAVTNDEIDELYARTPIGIPIEILP